MADLRPVISGLLMVSLFLGTSVSAEEAPETCGDLAIPVTEVIVGNGGSWYQVYQEFVDISDLIEESPQDDEMAFAPQWPVYISYALATNNINNGADDWVFGYELSNDRFSPTEIHEYGAKVSQHEICMPVGQAPRDFDVYVDAGAGGWSGSSSCSVGFHWEVTVGVEVGLTSGGASGSAETSLGGSIECTDGAEYDSESLLRGGTSASLV